MIENKNRSGWIGASDTAMVMGNWGTGSFLYWWKIKLGLCTGPGPTRQQRAGTAYEHRILEHLGVRMLDRQIREEELRLRVNLDGEEPRLIHEVKTYGKNAFSVTKEYWMQCQIEMFATSLHGETRKDCRIDAYRLLPSDYDCYENPIDPARLSRRPIPYNPGWVSWEYIPRLRYLAACLKTGEIPNLLMVTMKRKEGDPSLLNGGNDGK